MYSIIAEPCVKVLKKEIFHNLAARLNSETHKRCLKGYPGNLPGTFVLNRLEWEIFGAGLPIICVFHRK